MGHQLFDNRAKRSSINLVQVIDQISKSNQGRISGETHHSFDEI